MDSLTIQDHDTSSLYDKKDSDFPYTNIHILHISEAQFSFHVVLVYTDWNKETMDIRRLRRM